MFCLEADLGLSSLTSIAGDLDFSSPVNRCEKMYIYWKMLGMSQKIVANEDFTENAKVVGSDDGTLQLRDHTFKIS